MHIFVIFVQILMQNTICTMTTKHIITLSGIITMILLMPSCRTSKHTTASSTSTTSIAQNAIDSATRSLMASQSHKLTITYIPGFQITTPDLPIPRTNNTLQDLTNQLIEQGGGTLINGRTSLGNLMHIKKEQGSIPASLNPEVRCTIGYVTINLLSLFAVAKIHHYLKNITSNQHFIPYLCVNQ